MNVVIDIESSTPLFTQLMMQIKQAIVEGHIKAGDQLPSIRQLANDLRINNKTVAKSYQLLERDLIIESKGYRGTFVHPQAVENCNVDLTAQINETLDAVVQELRGQGVTDSEIRIAFSKVMSS